MKYTEKQAERLLAIEKIYRLVLVHRWHIINFHDKWTPNDFSVLLWSDNNQKAIVRIPL